MKKALTSLLVAMGAIFLFASPAQATEAPQYALVAWKITSTTSDHFGTPQTIITSIKTNSADLTQVNELLPCGVKVQVDLYANGEKADVLVAGGILYGSGNPHEPWPGGSYQSSYSNVFTTPDCTQPPDEVTPGTSEIVDCAAHTVTIKNWQTTITYKGDRTGWVAQPPVRTELADGFRMPDSKDCPPPVVVKHPWAQAPELAHTGPAEDEFRTTLAGGILFAVSGLALLLTRKRWAK